MNKAFSLILIALLIAQYIGAIDSIDDLVADPDSECEKKRTANGVSDCEKLKAGADTNKCCFIEAESEKDGQKGTYKSCISITKDSYDKIADIIDDMEDAYEKAGVEGDISIDCSSNYIILSLISLTILLL